MEEELKDWRRKEETSESCFRHAVCWILSILGTNFLGMESGTKKWCNVGWIGQLQIYTGETCFHMQRFGGAILEKLLQLLVSDKEMKTYNKSYNEKTENIQEEKCKIICTN